MGHNALSDCLELLNALAVISDGNRGQEADERTLLAESLGAKFIQHAMSALHLRKGTRLNEMGAMFHDFGSVHVLTRAAYESVLTFSHLFGSKNEDDRIFRFCAWAICDLQKRQQFPIFSDQGRACLARDRVQISNLQETIRSTKKFGALSERQRNAYLEGRQNRPGWRDLGLEMGLDKTHAEHFYSFLCSHAHSGYLSVLQTQQALTPDIRQELMNGTVGVLAISSAHMVHLYSSFFPRCESILNDQARVLVKMWITIGATSLEQAAQV